MENQTQPTPPAQSGGPKKQNTKMIIIIIAVVIVVLLIGFFIYRAIANKVTETALEKMIEAQTGSKVDIDRDGQTIKITGEDGEGQVEIEGDEEGSFTMKFTDEEGKEGEFSFESSEEGLDIPDSLKNALPIFTPSKMIALNDMEDMGVAGTFVTEKDADDIKKYYLEEMADAGWKKIGEFSTEQTTSINFEKDNQTATVLIYENDDGQHFNLSIYNK